MAYIIFVIVIAALMVAVAFYAKSYTEAENKIEEQRRTIELKDKMIVAMKRVVEGQRYLHGKLQEISNAKTVGELNNIYSNIFK